MCITGEAGGFRDHFGAKKKKEKKNGSNVTTCQYRDVPISRHSSSMTSQCRDVWSTKEKVNDQPNVATSQRHDVIAISASES